MRSCLIFTLAEHGGNGGAHPYLRVSVGNAEEAELDLRGGPEQKGA